MLARKELSVTLHFIGRIAITIWLLSSLSILLYDFYFLLSSTFFLVVVFVAVV